MKLMVIDGIPSILGEQARSPQRDDLASRQYVLRIGLRICRRIRPFLRRSQQPCQSGQEQRRFLRNLRPSHRQTKRRISVRQTLGRMSRPDLVRHRICATILIRHIRHTTYPIGTAFPTIRHAQRKGMFASRTTFPQQHYQHHRARSRQGRLA